MKKDIPEGAKRENFKTKRYYNQKTMVGTVVVASAVAYSMGKNKGARMAYLEGVKDGIAKGLAEGKLEGYVAAISDVASVMRYGEY